MSASPLIHQTPPDTSRPHHPTPFAKPVRHVATKLSAIQLGHHAKRLRHRHSLPYRIHIVKQMKCVDLPGYRGPALPKVVPKLADGQVNSPGFHLIKLNRVRGIDTHRGFIS